VAQAVSGRAVAQAVSGRAVAQAVSGPAVADGVIVVSASMLYLRRSVLF